MPSSDYTPDVADVAVFLRTRTRDTNGVELGTFTTATRPTAAEVDAIIADTVVNMEDDLGVDIDERLWSSAKRVTALRAAMAIEVSYFSEQVAAGRSVYPQLKEWYEEDLDRLNASIIETAEGGDIGSDAGENTPLWGGGDLPFTMAEGLLPYTVDPNQGIPYPAALGASRKTSIAAAVGSQSDPPSPSPESGSLLGYLRRIRDLLSGTLNVNVVSGGGGGGATGGLTDTELRASPVPVIGPATDAEIRATPIPVSSSALTDAQLRAARVPVDPGAGPFPVSISSLPLPTGASTEATLATLSATTGTPGDAAWASGNGTVIALLKKIASSGAASGLTDAQLRATPVPVDTGVVHVIIDSGGGGSSSGGLTDTELRASDVEVNDSSGNTLLGQIYGVLANTLGWSTAYQHNTSDLGQIVFGVRKDVPAALSADNYYHTMEFDASGRLYVNVHTSALPTGASTETTVASVLTGIGAPGDAAATTTGSLIAQARRIANLLAGTLTVSGTVAVSGTVPVTGPVTDAQLRASAVPVSLAAVPLPTGAATEVTVGLAATALGAPGDAAATTTGSVIAQLRRVANLLAGTLTVSGAVSVSGSVAVTGPLTDTQLRATAVPVSGPVTDAQLRASAVPVSLASVPTHAVTGSGNFATTSAAASQADGHSATLGSTTDAAATTTGSVIAQLRRIANLLAGTLTATVSGTVAISGSVAVTGTFWQATQPVSGTFWQATQPVSAASLPLPTGAATEATLTSGLQQAINRGGAKGATAAATVTSTASGADHQGLDVTLYDNAGNRLGTSGTPVRTDPTGTTVQPVSAASLPLPAGAATETTLAAANTVLGATADAASSTTGTINAHLRSIAAALAGTLTATISGSVAVTGTFWQATQPVSGTFWQATQPISAASLPLPTGASTETTLASLLTTTGATADAATTGAGTVNAHLRSIAAALAGTLTVTGGGGGVQFAEDAVHTTGDLGTMALGVRKDTATALAGADGDYQPAIYDASGKLWVNVGTVPVTGTFWQATQPVSAASLPLPTGAATETTLASLLTTLGATGDAAGTGAVSVNAHLRSIAAYLTGTLAVSAASLPLPAGASTEATLAAVNTALGASADAASSTTGSLNAHLRSIAASVAAALTSNQGTANTAANAWPTKIVDSAGTNVAKVGASGGVRVIGGAPTGQSLAVTAATPVTGTGLDASEAGNATFFVKNTVAGTAYTGAPVIVFEQSDDNVSWAPLQVVRSDTGQVGSTWTLPAGAANASLAFDAGLEGVNWVRVRVTTAQTANGMTIVTNLGGMPFSPFVSGVNQAAAMGGWTTHKLISAATTNATSLKATPGQIGGWYIFNNAAAVRYVKLYNKASAPTVGTDVPVWVIGVPAGGAANMEFTNGLQFPVGIAYATTTGITDADATAVALSDLSISLAWK